MTGMIRLRMLFAVLLLLVVGIWGFVQAQTPPPATGVIVNASGTPSITLLSPSTGAIGSSVTITGVGFGSVKGTATVTFNGVVANTTAWSATSITATVPSATTGPVIVTQNALASAGVTFTVSGVVSNPIDPARKIDWSTAGVVGGIPPRTLICQTMTAASSLAAINTAIQNCPNGQAVRLSAGTYTLAGALVGKSGVTIRGDGANQTLINTTDHGFCNGLWTGVVLCGSGANPDTGFSQENWATWTAGYARGATSITVSSSLNIVAGVTFLNLDQLDETSDTGNIWNCLRGDSEGGNECANNPVGSGGFARHDHNCAAGYCSQQQEVLVTACAPACNVNASTVLTITPGLYMPNWRSAQSPGAWWATTTATGMGIEDLSIDTSVSNANCAALGQCVWNITLMNCSGCWVKGVRSMWASRNHVALFECFHCTVRDSYFFESVSHASVSYGIELVAGSSDALLENNIFQRVTDSTPNNNGGGAGSVAAYNFTINDLFAANGWMQPNDYEHASGYDFWLREGNDSIGFEADNVHGTHHFTTLFRNAYAGWQQLCNGVACSAQTVPVHLYASSRYFNLLGNVLGRSGYHNNYECPPSAAACGSGNTSIYTLGHTGNGGGTIALLNHFCLNPPTCSSTGAYDPLTKDSLFRWGNYDTVTATTKFDTTEVPSTLSPYGNPIPGSTTLPASLYLSAKPSFFQSLTWPGIGPDVAGGDVANLGGHVWRNPARVCAETTMGIAFSDTTPKAFNRVTCYGP
jgi:hypothetical protein